MLIKEFERIKGMLESLGSSTCVDIQFKDLLYSFCGRRSTYESHRVITIESKGHRTQGTVLLDNDKYSIIVSCGVEAIKTAGHYSKYITKVEYPAFMVRNYAFNDTPIDLPLWMQQYPLLDLYYIDPFEGFDENGNPIFNDKVKNMSLYISDGEITLIKDSESEDE